MSRDTACFSMYSDMSMRTMARSSSKRNSARARASSVFPRRWARGTGTNPGGGWGPPGRSGSGEWRRLTAWTASFCPMTRWCSSSSSFKSLAISPWSILVTGMPVHLDTTWATSSSSTSSLSILVSFCTPARRSWASFISFSRAGGAAAETELRGFAQVPRAFGLLLFELQGFEFPLDVPDAATATFSTSHCFFMPSEFFLSLAMSFSNLSRRSLLGASDSF
jgi:hypothetical protein